MRRVALAIGLVVTVIGCSSAGSNGPQAPELTDAFPCGFGFYLSDAEQSAGLFISYVDFEGARAGEVIDSARLPGDGWRAEYQTGTDLFANWCDDVMEPGEPVPVIEEVWRVTGNLEVTGLPAAGQCGRATAELTDIEADNGDGDTISLGDYSVVNDSWGCFAG